MKAKKLLLLFLLSMATTGYCTTWTVTNSGFAFSPNNLPINSGDNVNFQLESIHDVLEVSLATWQANGTSPLSGGFQTGLGGGVVTALKLTVGTHYYVCTFHVQSNQMKGMITVTALGVNDFQLVKSFTIFPNPATEFVNLKVNDSSFDLPYTIIDQEGRQVSSGRLSDITTLVDLRQLSSGIYFMQMGEDRRQIFKLIKK